MPANWIPTETFCRFGFQPAMLETSENETLVDVLKVMGRRRLERDEEIDIGRPRNSGALGDGADGNDPVLISVRPLLEFLHDVASREGREQVVA